MVAETFARMVVDYVRDPTVRLKVLAIYINFAAAAALNSEKLKLGDPRAGRQTWAGI